MIDVMLLEYGESRETYLIEPGIDDFMQATTSPYSCCGPS